MSSKLQTRAGRERAGVNPSDEATAMRLTEMVNCAG